MCKTKNFVVEVIEGAENRRTYIVRELASMPNVPPVTRFCTDDVEELAQFFSNGELFGTNEKN